MKDNLKYILAALTVVIAVVAIWYFRSIVAYILIAAVFSLIGRPIVDFLNRIKLGKIHLNKTISAALTLLLFWAVFFGFLRIFVPLIGSEAQDLSEIDYSSVRSDFQIPLDRLENLYYRLNPEGSEGVSMEEYIESRITSSVNLSVVSNAIGGTVDILGSLFIAIFSISFITFFFLKHETLFEEGLMLFVPVKHEQKFEHFFRSSKALLTRYFAGILLQVSGITLLVTIGLTIVGLKFQLAAVIGLVAGIMNVIPYIGPLIGASIGLLLGIANNLDLDLYHKLLPLLGYMFLVFIIVQIIDNVLFQPVIYGKSVKAHPLEIFLVILIAGNLAGIVGMILAIPSYTVLRVFAREFFYQFKVVQKITEKIE
ncbi:MAG: AI-2E family transporter [Bacteroidales bacterium]|nr:AI-2E family transporter [Bacteroidales bacterium]